MHVFAPAPHLASREALAALSVSDDMKPHRLTPTDALDAAAGMVLCQDVDVGGAKLAKGRVLGDADLAALRGGARPELHLIELEPGDVHEDAAGERLARAVPGEGVEARAPQQGHWPLAATRRGLLEVSEDALRRANAVEGVCVYTLYDGQVVDAGEIVARAKVLPFAIADDRLREAEAAARDASGIVRVRPFAARTAGAVVQESLGARAQQRFAETLGEKLAWFGATLMPPVLVAPESAAIAAALDRLVARGADLLVLAGAKPMDPLDPSWQALDAFGVRVESFGVPAHPGSLLWIAWRGDVPLLGMPTCGVFAHATAFDVVLPRVLAGERVTRAALQQLGHGGFLTAEMAFRFPAYRGAGSARGVLDTI